MLRSWIAFGLAALLPAASVLAADKPVRVFILAGQSNMEGKARNTLLDYQATEGETRGLFAHLRRDDQWIVRDDVFIKFLDRRGPLTVGFGSPGCTGVELEFGTRMGEHFDEPVLLIKAAWGGHSLFKNFRSPSAGLPETTIAKELAETQKRVQQANEKDNKQDPLPTRDEIVRDYGQSYRNLLKEVRDVQENYARLFPTLEGRSLELTGFVWFQGFNDIFGAQEEYAANMRHFIHDVRTELQAPQLPFVIGALGQNGSKPATGGMLVVREAQLSMNDVPEFRGTVKAFPVDVLVDKAAEEMFPNWQNNPEWVHTGSDRPYHYYGSAIWFNRIGQAMGQAMVDLLTKTP